MYPCFCLFLKSQQLKKRDYIILMASFQESVCLPYACSHHHLESRHGCGIVVLGHACIYDLFLVVCLPSKHHWVVSLLIYYGSLIIWYYSVFFVGYVFHQKGYKMFFVTEKICYGLVKRSWHALVSIFKYAYWTKPWLERTCRSSTYW